MWRSTQTSTAAAGTGGGGAIIVKKDDEDKHKNGGNNDRGRSRVTTKMYIIAMVAWAKSQWHPLFLVRGGRVGGNRSRDYYSGGSLGLEGKRHPQQQDQQ